jgi:hypothetical protein
MSFIDKIKQTTNKTSNKAVFVSTKDVTKELNKFATSYGISYNLVDFKIKSIQASIQQQISLLNIDINKIDEYLSYNSIIQQTFDIEIFMSKKRKFIIKNKILISKSKTQAFMVISKHSKIPYNDSLKENLLMYINKEKAKYNILLNVQEGSLSQDLDNLIELLKKDKLKEDFKIQIAHLTLYQTSKPGYIKYLYLDEMYHKYIKQSFVYVKEQEKVLDIFIGKDGQDGFNVFGEIKTSKPIKRLDTSHINLSDNIIQKNIDGHIYAIAKISGMVTFDGDIFDIQTVFNLYQINIKNCVYFDAPIEEKSISLNISTVQEDTDAVNANTKLKAHNITILGNIGSNVRLEASIVKISGFTHKNSKIYAKEAYINIHRGYVEADYVEIMNVEHGEVQAREVRINSTIGGNISSRDVFIQKVNNYTTIQASHSIDIISLFGKHNDYIITPTADMGQSKKIIKILKDMNTFKKNHKPSQLYELKQRYVIYIKKQKSLKEKLNLMDSKDSQYMAIAKILYTLNQRIKYIKDIFLLKTQYVKNIHLLAKYDDDIKEASVLLHDTWKKHNLIIFKQISKNETSTLEPEGKYGKIYMKNKDNTSLSIKGYVR